MKRPSNAAPCLLWVVVLGLVLGLQVSTPRARTQAGDTFTIPASDDGLPGVGPIRRYEWFQSLWRSRRSAWAAERERDQGAVVFLGDSITQQWEPGLPLAFPGMKMANRGISGDTTRGLLLRLDEDVLAVNPSAVVLLIGTNDLEAGATPEMIEHNMRLLLERLQAHDSRMPVILSLVFPSADSMKRPADRIREVNARYLALIRDNPQVTPLETWRLFADADGNARTSEFPDLLHPNAAGYEKWASALRPILEAHRLLPVVPDEFSVEPGFELLFNGRDLTGWGYRPTTDADKESARRWQASDPNAALWPFLTETTSFAGRQETVDGRFRVVGGRIVVMTPAEYRVIQQLWTEREFPEDFVLKLEFRATPFADSGLYLRRTQLQVRDYGLAGPYGALSNYKPQDWNEIVVTVRGSVAEVTCNGEVLEAALRIPATGPLGLEGDRGQTEYRRIRIQRLTPP